MLPFSPVAINDAGQIAGHSVIMGNGVITDLNTLLGGSLDILHMNGHGNLLAYGKFGGLDGFYYIGKTGLTPIYTWDLDGEPQLLYAEGMNDQGDVVGEFIENIIGTPWHAFLWKDGVRTNLQEIPKVGLYTARDINNYGVIVGESAAGSVRWVGGVIELLGIDPDDDGAAMAVNDAGTIAIESWQLFVWKSGSYAPLTIPKPGEHKVYFRALNEKDELLVSGYYYDDQEQPYFEPMVHNKSGTYMLNCAVSLEEGSRISDATDMNNLGQIVGTMKVPGQEEEVGILLNPSDLPTQKGGVKIYLPLIAH
jgi:probable HAF family extracellular repeat protein